MNRNEVITKIADLSKDAALSFTDKVKRIELSLKTCSAEDILDHLDYAGIIPEYFKHDSTEEKLFAKYCDALLARALTELGLTTRIIEARADAADVEAEGYNYKLVGDAKGFRLSRTAKNQKDFKVEALNQWRQNAGADYTCLVGPLYQYPNTNSQIYEQAIRYNVTLLSYTHLAFMIRSKKATARGLIELWEVGRNLPPTQNASVYWPEILRTVLRITGRNSVDWDTAVKDIYTRLREQADEQVRYWEEERRRIQALDRETAVTLLIKALKIDAKIAVIKKFVKSILNRIFR